VRQPQAQDPNSKLEEVITVDKPHLPNREFRELEEHLTEYKGVFAGDNEDYGRTINVSH
jgi:hypothetical protein